MKVTALYNIIWIFPRKAIQGMALDMDLKWLFTINTKSWEQVVLKASKATFYHRKGIFSMKDQKYLKKVNCMRMQCYFFKVLLKLQKQLFSNRGGVLKKGGGEVRQMTQISINEGVQIKVGVWKMFSVKSGNPLWQLWVSQTTNYSREAPV